MPFIQIQFRRGTKQEWIDDNPVLAEAEMGIETDTSLYKIGNGVSDWVNLPYGGLQGPGVFSTIIARDWVSTSLLKADTILSKSLISTSILKASKVAVNGEINGTYPSYVYPSGIGYGIGTPATGCRSDIGGLGLGDGRIQFPGDIVILNGNGDDPPPDPTKTNIDIRPFGRLAEGKTRYTTSIGYGAGFGYQLSNAIAIGTFAGNSNQGSNTVAIGYGAGNFSQDGSAIAIGNLAGNYNQGITSIAVGQYSGLSNQADAAIAIGNGAGYNQQKEQTVAVGWQAGYNGQKAWATAIGYAAGYSNQGGGCIAIGTSAGLSNQFSNAVAIGPFAGSENQGLNSIAIGAFAGGQNQPDRSIILNATGNGVYTSYPSNTDACYIRPIRNVAGNVSLQWNTNSSEVSYQSSDSNVKREIETARNYLDDLCQLRPVTFKYISSMEGIPNKKYLGFIAQEVEKVFPSMVFEHNSTLILNDTALPTMLVTAVQSLHSTNQGLQDTIRLQQEQISQLFSKFN